MRWVMWWKNYLIVFLVTSVLVVVSMFSCTSSPKAVKVDQEQISSVKASRTTPVASVQVP